MSAIISIAVVDIVVEGGREEEGGMGLAAERELIDGE